VASHFTAEDYVLSPAGPFILDNRLSQEYERQGGAGPQPAELLSYPSGDCNSETPRRMSTGPAALARDRCRSSTTTSGPAGGSATVVPMQDGEPGGVATHGAAPPSPATGDKLGWERRRADDAGGRPSDRRQGPDCGGHKHLAQIGVEPWLGAEMTAPADITVGPDQQHRRPAAIGRREAMLDIVIDGDPGWDGDPGPAGASAAMMTTTRSKLLCFSAANRSKPANLGVPSADGSAGRYASRTCPVPRRIGKADISPSQPAAIGGAIAGRGQRRVETDAVIRHPAGVAIRHVDLGVGEAVGRLTLLAPVVLARRPGAGDDLGANRTALSFIAVEQPLGRGTVDHQRQLPGQIVGVLDAGVDALAAGW